MRGGGGDLERNENVNTVVSQSGGILLLPFPPWVQKEEDGLPLPPKKKRIKIEALLIHGSLFALRSGVEDKVTCDGEMIFIKDVFFFMGRRYWRTEKAIMRWCKKKLAGEQEKNADKKCSQVGKASRFHE